MASVTHMGDTWRPPAADGAGRNARAGGRATAGKGRGLPPAPRSHRYRSAVTSAGASARVRTRVSQSA
jgi:hypothetical protein